MGDYWRLCLPALPDFLPLAPGGETRQYSIRRDKRIFGADPHICRYVGQELLNLHVLSTAQKTRQAYLRSWFVEQCWFGDLTSPGSRPRTFCWPAHVGVSLFPGVVFATPKLLLCRLLSCASPGKMAKECETNHLPSLF